MGVDRVELRQATCPANTLQSAPVVVDCSFTPGKVIGIGLVIPWGHAYLTGLAIAQAQQIVIPRTGDSWFTSDDEKLQFDYNDQIYSGSWQVFTYNTDEVNDHSWYLRFYIQELTAKQEAVAKQQLTPADLAAVANLDLATTGQTGG